MSPVSSSLFSASYFLSNTLGSFIFPTVNILLAMSTKARQTERLRIFQHNSRTAGERSRNILREENSFSRTFKELVNSQGLFKGYGNHKLMINVN